MKFTLYVDESGDFETPRGEWVLAGVLFSDSYDNCEKLLKKKLDRFPKTVGQRSIKDFHLTEFRRDIGHDRAMEIADNLYRQLGAMELGYYAIATINHTKSSLSEREKTYRLMLGDLLAICETVLSDGEVISRLDIVVASRTINGEKQTTISDLNNDIIATLPSALEMGLATKGLIRLMGKNIKLHMDYANNSWGLVAADFLANINYHYRRDNESKFLSKLSTAGKFQLFESLGSLDARRARVAERDKDYAKAINRWLDIDCVNASDINFDAEINRLLDKLFRSLGTTGYKVEFENLLELLWRSGNRADQYPVLYSKLARFERVLCNYIKEKQASFATGLVFRLRNMMLLVLNHLGKVADASQLIEKQLSVIPELATNPEYFHIVLDFKILQTECHVNAMEITTALSLAEDYVELVENYKGLWQLLLSDDDVKEFDKSRLRIKSEMSLFRLCVLAIGVIDSPTVARCWARLLELEHSIEFYDDSSRLSSYKAMYFLKQNKPNNAVSLLISELNIRRWGLYDIHGLLRATNDSLLKSIPIDVDAIASIIEQQLADTDLTISGHPVDIVLRELSLFESLRGNTSKAKKLITRSRAALATGDAAIFDYLQVLTDIHEDYLYSRLKTEQRYLSNLSGDIPAAMAKSDMPLLIKFRYYSFY